MKTDLTKILSISGQNGLFLYISQARAGAIVEALADKKRSCFGMNSRLTTLADISIYTEEGETKLKEVFLKMKDVLGDADAPGPKSSADELKAFFEKALPDYDRSRFYVSHMKKVVDWYNTLKKYASLDFAEETEKEQETAEEEQK
ncbi:MAG: DUF5606 domain-containing protein [Bacteroidetes bacterium]|uniref:DUF5606 domain-containing protein n=1 Tax=Candidatus Cryptobacteroides excrementipullorum TaxID=2840761 RepID=A0A9D9ITC6_9BACT|nr:DUF5606 domain-containing protein [Candidatus Cryptobacteroides excrementipullorum]